MFWEILFVIFDVDSFQHVFHLMTSIFAKIFDKSHTSAMFLKQLFKARKIVKWLIFLAFLFPSRFQEKGGKI